MKVTRIAYSDRLNAGKFSALEEQAARLGDVRALVWRQFGSLAGVGVSDRDIRDRWLADGTAETFNVLANAWKETVRDASSDIRASREAAKTAVRRVLRRTVGDEQTRRHLYLALRSDNWMDDPYLRRLMRQYWRRGRSRVRNQIVVRSDRYRTFQLAEDGNIWLAIPGLERRSMLRIPLRTRIAPSGTLRLILRNNLVEVHYALDSNDSGAVDRPHGAAKLGVDKGYTEVLTDSDGTHLGTELGSILRSESDHRKAKNARRAKLRSVAEKAAEQGDQAKAARIISRNLGGAKRSRRQRSFEAKVRTVTFTAVNQAVDKSRHIVAEDLTRSFRSRGPRDKNTTRRLAAWTKGVTAEALNTISERRGSALTLVNAAYTSQVTPCCRLLGERSRDRLYCPECRAVWQADHAAAINILNRDGDPEISLYTPHQRVKQIIQGRTDRHRTRLPVLDSSITTVRRANYPIRSATINREAGTP